MLRAYDKATGKEVGAVYMPAPQTGSPMTYMLNGQQYIVVATSGGTVQRRAAGVQAAGGVPRDIETEPPAKAAVHFLGPTHGVKVVMLLETFCWVLSRRLA